MTSFAGLVGTARKPPRVVTLKLDDFADTYDSKPPADVAIGLRLISEKDLEVARGQAARKVADAFTREDGAPVDEQAQDEAYNDALIVWAVAKACCNPNNVAQPYFDMAEDILPVALKPEAIRFLWDELVLLMKGRGSSFPEATDEEIVEIGDLIAGGALERLSEAQASELRKLLAYTHSVLSAADA